MQETILIVNLNVLFNQLYTTVMAISYGFYFLPFIFNLFWLSVKYLAIMNSDFKLDQRAYIKIRTLLGFATKDVLADLEIVYKDVSIHILL